MSFSSDIKMELSKITNLAKKDLVKAEFIGYLLTGNIDLKNRKILYSTESKYNINRFAKLLNNNGVAEYEIEIQGKNFIIKFLNDLCIEQIKYNKNGIIVDEDKMTEFLKSEILDKALIRGTFLGAGFLNNPEREYHLEIVFNSMENIKFIENTLNKYNIKVRNLQRKNKFSLYIKDGEEISKFLAFIEANSSVLRFEELRVLRDIRNNVNRIVNCETANLNKTVDASLKQIHDIEFIKSKNKFNELTDSLKEIAELRLENPEATLVELSKMLKKPVGKSGVNHRLKAISKFAEELR